MAHFVTGNKIKKSYLFFLIITAFTLVFLIVTTIGCGGDQEGENKDAEKEEKFEVEFKIIDDEGEPADIDELKIERIED